MSQEELFDHLPGQQRSSSDKKIHLGKKVNLSHLLESYKKQLLRKGMLKVNLITQWDKIISPIYAKFTQPIAIRRISSAKVLICHVLYTRIIEIQHEKTNFIKQINLFANQHLIDDIIFKRVDVLPPQKKYQHYPLNLSQILLIQD